MLNCVSENRYAEVKNEVRENGKWEKIQNRSVGNVKNGFQAGIAKKAILKIKKHNLRKQFGSADIAQALCTIWAFGIKDVTLPSFLYAKRFCACLIHNKV